MPKTCTDISREWLKMAPKKVELIDNKEHNRLIKGKVCYICRTKIRGQYEPFVLRTTTFPSGKKKEEIRHLFCEEFEGGKFPC